MFSVKLIDRYDSDCTYANWHWVTGERVLLESDNPMIWRSGKAVLRALNLLGADGLTHLQRLSEDYEVLIEYKKATQEI